MAFTGSSRVAETSDLARTTATGFWVFLRSSSRLTSMVFSVSIAILVIVFTASAGYFPYALSPLSMIASALWNMALAMSVTSALVGRGLSIMLWSIWVAMITGFFLSLHFLTISFCISGMRSAGISTPRSPLATITP